MDRPTFISFLFLDSGDPKQQQQPPIPPMNPRVILTLFLVYLILSYLVSSGEDQRKQNGLSGGLISWNEFVQDMLSKGEVRHVFRIDQR